MQNPSAPSDDVDILLLLVNLYRFILKNWLLVVLSFAVVGGASWFLFSRTDRVYESRMIVFSEFLTEAYASPVVKNLMDLIKEQNAAGLSTKLGLPPAESQSLKRISVESPTGERLNLPEKDKKIFVISVETTDPAILPKLQASLINYFQNVEFVKLRTEEKRKFYQGTIARIKLEIESVDRSGTHNGSLHTYKDPANQANSPSAVIFDPSTTLVYMQNELGETEEKLALLKGVEVIDGFSIYLYPVRPKGMIYIASAITASILLATLLLAMRSFSQVLKKYPA